MRTWREGDPVKFQTVDWGGLRTVLYGGVWFLTAIITRFDDLSAAKCDCQTIANVATPILIGSRMFWMGSQTRKKVDRSLSSPCPTYSSRKMRLCELDCQRSLVYEDATFAP